MADKKQKWCAARSLYSTSFHPVPADQVRMGCHTWVEHSPKSFTSYDQAQKDAERLNEECKCAEWEFSDLVRKFAQEAGNITSNQKYFRHGTHSEVRDQIWAAIQMVESMANAMVAQELLNRNLKEKWG